MTDVVIDLPAALTSSETIATTLTNGVAVDICLWYSGSFSASFSTVSATDGSVSNLSSSGTALPTSEATAAVFFTYTPPASGTTDDLEIQYSLFGTTRTKTVTLTGFTSGSSGGGGNTYTVNIFATSAGDTGFDSISFTASGTTGTGQSSSNPILLEGGDTVTFNISAADFGQTINIAGFDAGQWDSTTALNLGFNGSGDRVWATGQTQGGTSLDSVTLSTGSVSDIIYFEQAAASVTLPVINSVTLRDSNNQTTSSEVLSPVSGTTYYVHANVTTGDGSMSPNFQPSTDFVLTSNVTLTSGPTGANNLNFIAAGGSTGNIIWSVVFDSVTVDTLIELTATVTDNDDNVSLSVTGDNSTLQAPAVDLPPTIPTITRTPASGNADAYGSDTIAISASASDPEGGQVGYQFSSSNTSIATISPAANVTGNATVTFLDNNTNSDRDVVITVTALDGASNSSSNTITLTQSANTAPNVTITNKITSISSGDTHDFNFLVTDDNTGITPAVVWSIQSGNGSISTSGVYTPPTLNVGDASQTVTVLVTATDTGSPNLSGTDTDTFTVNPPGATVPTITISPRPSSVDENTSQTYSVATSNVTQSTLSWSITGDGTITSATTTGVTSVDVAASDVTSNGQYVLSVTGTSTDGVTTGGDSIAVDVNFINQDPTVSIARSPASGLVAFTGGSVDLTATTSDPDGQAVSVAWSIVSGAANASLSDSTGSTTTITFGQTNSRGDRFSVVRATATDASGGTATQNITITQDGDDAPTITSLNVPSTGVAGTAFNISATTQSDASIAWTANGAGTFGDASAASTTFTPSNGGTYEITATPSDALGAGTASSDMVSVSVGGSTASINGPTSVIEGDTDTYSLSETIAPGSTVTSRQWTVVNGTINGSSTGTSISVTWDNTPTNAGLTGTVSCDITLSAGSITDPSVSVAIANSDQAPVVSINNKLTTIASGGSHTFTATASDPDSDTITQTWSIISGGGSINSSTGAYTAPTIATGGSNVNAQIRVTATANGVSVTDDDFFTVTAPAAGSVDWIIEVSAAGDFEPGIGPLLTATVIPQSGGTGNGQNQANAAQMTAGDVVEIQYISAMNVGNLSVSGINGGFWNISGSLSLAVGGTSQIIWDSGITAGDSTTISFTVTGSNGVSASQTRYFQQPYVTPDTSVTTIEAINIAANTNTFTQTITEVAPNANSAITEYRILRGSPVALVGSRTGPGDITITDAAGFPFLGTPTTYFVYGVIPTTSGGDGFIVPVDEPYNSFTVTKGDAPGNNAPTRDPYGLAVYDDQGTFVTSFTQASFVPREIFSANATTSTSGTTDVSLGLTGVSADNCFAVIRGDAGTDSGSSDTERARNLAYGFVNGNTLRIGRDDAASNVRVSVIQYKDATITGTTTSHGINIYNGDGDLVIDDLASCYAVREVINLSDSNVTVYDSEYFDYAVIQLATGRYPSSGGVPIPAIQYTSGLTTLMGPQVGSVLYPDGSYRFVLAYLPKGTTLSSWNVAMLVDRSNTDPSYYGGSAPDYGLQIKDASGNLQWDSGWRQAIGNNVIPATTFSQGGTDATGTHDVVSNFDSATAPLQSQSEFEEGLFSYGLTQSVSGLNDMDPANTFLLGGNIISGRVQFYQGLYIGPDGSGPQYTFGGGTHVPGLSITGNNDVNITMVRTSQGPEPSGVSQYSTRVSSSIKPHGAFVLVRIT